MKRDISTIHPELQTVARKLPAITYSRKNLWLMNWVMRLRPEPKTPDNILIKNIFIPAQTDQARIRLRIYQPRSRTTPTPALLWLHGGGYVLGNPEQDDECCAQCARELEITVVSVDYRYAPKYPFPIGLEDSYAALRWVAAQVQSLSVDIQRIAIGGASGVKFPSFAWSPRRKAPGMARGTPGWAAQIRRLHCRFDLEAQSGTRSSRGADCRVSSK